MATRDGREIARHFSVVGCRSGLTRAEVTSGGHAHTCTSLDHRQVQPPWPDPEGSFPLSRLNLRCLKHCVITWGGVRPSASGRAPSFREVARCPRECEHSSGVAVLCGAAAPSSRSRLSPEEGLRLK